MTLAGWMNCNQQDVIECLREENWVLRLKYCFKAGNLSFWLGRAHHQVHQHDAVSFSMAPRDLVANRLYRNRLAGESIRHGRGDGFVDGVEWGATTMSPCIAL